MVLSGTSSKINMATGWQTNVIREAEKQGRLHELCYLVVVDFPGWLALGEPEQVWEEFPGVAMVFPVSPDPRAALARCSDYCMGLRLHHRGLGLMFRPFLQGFEDAWRHGVEFIWEGKEVDCVDERTGEVIRRGFAYCPAQDGGDE